MVFKTFFKKCTNKTNTIWALGPEYTIYSAYESKRIVQQNLVASAHAHRVKVRF